MRVAELMKQRVHSVPPETDADTAWDIMRRQQIDHLIVMRGRVIAGVLSDRDLGGRAGAPLRTGRTVGDLMTKKVVSIGPDDTVRSAANLMRGRKISCLPVVENGRLAGIVTVSDLLRLIGRGVDRPSAAARPPTHFRVAHRKQHAAPRAW